MSRHEERFWGIDGPSFPSQARVKPGPSVLTEPRFASLLPSPAISGGGSGVLPAGNGSWLQGTRGKDPKELGGPGLLRPRVRRGQRGGARTLHRRRGQLRAPSCVPSEELGCPGGTRAGVEGCGEGAGKAPGAEFIDGAALATVSPIGVSIRLGAAQPQPSFSLFKLRRLLRARAGTRRRVAPCRRFFLAALPAPSSALTLSPSPGTVRPLGPCHLLPGCPSGLLHRRSAFPLYTPAPTRGGPRRTGPWVAEWGGGDPKTSPPIRVAGLSLPQQGLAPSPSPPHAAPPVPAPPQDVPSVGIMPQGRGGGEGRSPPPCPALLWAGGIRKGLGTAA